MKFLLVAPLVFLSNFATAGKSEVLTLKLNQEVRFCNGTSKCNTGASLGKQVIAIVLTDHADGVLLSGGWQAESLPIDDKTQSEFSVIAQKTSKDCYKVIARAEVTATGQVWANRSASEASFCGKQSPSLNLNSSFGQSYPLTQIDAEISAISIADGP